ncbi:MAG TPA: phage Gp37/Gp68 family protein [Candidatus Udaeobacter sp.]
MAANSHIEWTEATWNPVTGCTKVSAGCKNCYAERLALRLQAMGTHRYRNGFRVTLQQDIIELPKRWREPRLIFVNSMSDLFHEQVPFAFIRRVFVTMRECPQHTFQILTKRSSRLRKLASQLDWPANVWMGVSVEDSRVLWRIDDLRKVPAAIRFLSCEPLIGSLTGMDLTDIHWVIVGGESGWGARPMKIEWIREIFKACRKHDIPFFFKQWGGVRKHITGRLLNGKTYDDMPARAAA